MESLPTSLQEFILQKLSSLSLSIPPVDESSADFIEGIINEDSFDSVDKRSAILGLLELEEGDEVAEKVIDDLVTESTAYSDEEAARLKDNEDEKRAAAELAAELLSSKKVLTPEEERLRKQKLISSYEFVDEQEEAERKAKSEADVTPSVVFPDPKIQSKKARKKAEAGMDILMMPNINAAVVKGAELQRRQADAAASQAKRERDKGDLKKQKDDAVKKAEDKKKKAQKGERRA